MKTWSMSTGMVIAPNRPGWPWSSGAPQAWTNRQARRSLRLARFATDVTSGRPQKGSNSSRWTFAEKDVFAALNELGYTSGRLDGLVYSYGYLFQRALSNSIRRLVPRFRHELVRSDARSQARLSATQASRGRALVNTVASRIASKFSGFEYTKQGSPVGWLGNWLRIS